jgi:hypothetical protein
LFGRPPRVSSGIVAAKDFDRLKFVQCSIDETSHEVRFRVVLFEIVGDRANVFRFGAVASLLSLAEPELDRESSFESSLITRRQLFRQTLRSYRLFCCEFTHVWIQMFCNND